MKEQLKNIGKEAEYFLNEMCFNVKITDVRKSFNRIDYEITPVSGEGFKWVSDHKLFIKKEG